MSFWIRLKLWFKNLNCKSNCRVSNCCDEVKEIVVINKEPEFYIDRYLEDPKHQPQK